MDLRCAFLNCENLFPAPNQWGRGTSSPTVLQRKIDLLADTVKQLFGKQPPHVFGLCEVGDKVLGQRLADQISPGKYTPVWAWPSAASIGQTGLVLFYDARVLSRTQTAENSFGWLRPMWLAAEFQFLGGSKGVFWAVVNHWSSDYKTDPLMANGFREDTATALADYYHQTMKKTSEAVLCIGDFNCEPGDRPFRGLIPKKPNVLRSLRERQQVLNATKLPVFYCPMWRPMVEPDSWEKAKIPGYTPPRSLGTYLSGATGWKMWDQCLVSPRLLRGGPAVLLEESLEFAEPIKQCSDHHAIGFVLECK